MLRVYQAMSVLTALSCLGWSRPAPAQVFSDAKAKQLIGLPVSRASNAQMICSVSSFFSVDSNEQVGDRIKVEGRGLATCKNDQGFTTEVPIKTEIDAKVVGSWANAGELSFSANSSSFILSREIGQLQDVYRVKLFASEIEKSRYFFEGTDHDVMMDVKLSSSTDALQKVQVQEMNIRIDENAPDLD